MIHGSRHSAVELLAAYDSALARQGRAPLTRVKYMHAARSFLTWLQADIVTVSALDIELFLAGWEAEHERRLGRRPSTATVRARIAALRSLFAFLARLRTPHQGEERGPTPRCR